MSVPAHRRILGETGQKRPRHLKAMHVKFVTINHNYTLGATP